MRMLARLFFTQCHQIVHNMSFICGSVILYGTCSPGGTYQVAKAYVEGLWRSSADLKKYKWMNSKLETKCIKILVSREKVNTKDRKIGVVLISTSRMYLFSTASKLTAKVRFLLFIYFILFSHIVKLAQMKYLTWRLSNTKAWEPLLYKSIEVKIA